MRYIIEQRKRVLAHTITSSNLDNVVAAFLPPKLFALWLQLLLLASWPVLSLLAGLALDQHVAGSVLWLTLSGFLLAWFVPWVARYAAHLVGLNVLGVYHLWLHGNDPRAAGASCTCWSLETIGGTYHVDRSRVCA